MCRAFLIKPVKKLDENDRSVVFKILMNYVVNSFNKNNDEGFYVEFDKGSLRTMNYKKYLKFIMDNKSKIEKSSYVYGHLRLSTNKVSRKFIHGWNLDGYRCFHNGIVELVDKKKVNDSLDFFEAVKGGGFNKKSIMKQCKKRYGTGVFVMANPEEDIMYLLSKNTDLTLSLINTSILTMVSNDDIHTFDDEIDMDDSVRIKLGKVYFDREIYYELDGYIWDDRSEDFRNKLLIWKNNEFVSKLTVPETKYYNRKRNNKKDKSYSDDYYREDTINLSNGSVPEETICVRAYGNEYTLEEWFGDDDRIEELVTRNLSEEQFRNI